LPGPGLGNRSVGNPPGIVRGADGQPGHYGGIEGQVSLRETFVSVHHRVVGTAVLKLILDKLVGGKPSAEE